MNKTLFFFALAVCVASALVLPSAVRGALSSSHSSPHPLSGKLDERRGPSCSDRLRLLAFPHLPLGCEMRT